MLKKFLSMLLSFVMLIAVTTACALFILRTILSGPFLGNITTGIISESTGNENTIVEVILDEEVDSELKAIIDEEKINEEFGDYVSDYLKYASGMSGAEKPNLDELQNVIEESLEKYEEKTGKEIDDGLIDEYFNKLDRELDEVQIEQNSEMTQIFEIIYSEQLFYGSIAVSIGSFLLIYVLEKNLFKAIKKAGVVGIINGIGFTLLGFALMVILSSVAQDDKTVASVLEPLCSIILKVGLTSFIGSIIVLILTSFLQKTNSKHNHSPVMYQKEDSVNDIQYLNQQNNNNQNNNKYSQ